MNKKKLFLVALILSCNLGIYAQGVSLRLRNVTVAKAMTELRKKTGYSFVYEGSDLNTRQRVNVDAKDLRQAADQILGSQNVTYTIQGKNIVVSAKSKQSQGQTRPQNTVRKEAGHRTVKGHVTDENGEPIIGASVRVKGASTGAVTDLDGNYDLSNVPDDATLEISYIGFKSQTLNVSGRSSVNISLLEDNKTLKEVVVVGFGTQKKADLTGAVATINGDELAQRPVQSAAQALQGVAPGLNITSTSGTLEATTSINVRGIGTIGQGSSGSPLILIDGVEGDINTINPQDIDNISVLKDAASSSIYGSRAPFGVILITTKNGGKSGKVTVNYNNSFRFSNLIRKKHMMNSVDFASWMNDANTNTGYGVFFDTNVMKDIVTYHNATPYSRGVRQAADGTLLYGLPISSTDKNQWAGAYKYTIDDVDWYDVVYKNTAFAMEHNASISGGSDKVNYYTSFNFLDNGGFINYSKDKYNRYTGTAKINAQLVKWARMSYNMRWSRTDYQRPTYMAKNQFANDLYTNMARQGWPTLPLYDRFGNLYSSPSPALGLATGGKDTTERDILSHQIGFILEPIKNWLTHIDFNYKTDYTTRHTDLQYTYNHNVEGEPVIYNTNSYVTEQETRDNYLNLQLYSEYSWSLKKAHNFHVMAGFQTEQLKRLFFSAQRNGILDPSKPEIDITSGLSYQGEVVTPQVGGNRNQWQTAGFFGRINYNYLERYLAEINLRYDGTSRFRTDNMWKLFPSFSLGWRISEEPFMNSTKSWIDNLKIRLSYGSLGNQNTNNWYQTYQTINYSATAGTWLQDGAKPNVTSAPNLVSTSLTWETVESYNAGLDYGFLNNRLNGSFDFYVRNTKNMVGNAPELPAILGTNVPVTNNTDLRTTGWEFQIGWHDTLKNGLFYSASFNISDARTKITKYPNNPTNSIDNYIAGRYLNEIWGYETIGIAQTEAEMNEHLKNADQSTLGSNWTAGDIMYKDLNGDKKISGGARTLADHGDLKVIGNYTPRYLFGLDLNASWKGFDVRAFFQGVMKRDAWIGGSWGNLEYLFGATNSGVWWATGITAVKDYWRGEDTWSVKNGYEKTNPNAWLPRATFSDKNEKCQTRYLMNAAYMRLKNLQIGYTLPRTLTQKWFIQNLRIYFSAENLWTITSMPKQFDPELLYQSSSQSAYNSNGYPLSKTFSFGINLTI
jgi:TonB-linked SusC/RagA family outer membrane protein